MTSHLIGGASIVLTETSVVDDRFRELCSRHCVTAIAGVPYSYELMLKASFLDNLPASVSTLTQAGGRLSPETVRLVANKARAHGARFFVMYGQTEATARIAYLPPELVFTHPQAIGRAIPGGKLTLINESGELIEGVGVEGELVYSGPNVMLGYAEDPEDLARGRTIDRLQTGDLAVRLKEEIYEITGRKSRFCKLQGRRFSFDDVEAMYANKGITAYVTGDDAGIIVLLPPGSDCASEHDWLSERLDVVANDLHIFADEAPRLPSGKVDYQAIRAIGSEALKERQEVSSVMELFENSFRRPCEDGESFQSLAGDSLNYVHVSMGLEELLGYLPDNWDARSIGELEILAQSAKGSRGWFARRTLGSDILLRALAIVAICINHASDTWAVAGGANILLIIFGMNFFRYQYPSLADRGSWRGVLGRFLLQVLAPYFALLLIFELATGKLTVADILLVSNFQGRYSTLLEPYWFIEVIFQALILLVFALTMKGVRRLLDRHTWITSTVITALLAALSIYLARGPEAQEVAYRTPGILLWLIALGFAVVASTTWRQKAFLSLLVGAMIVICRAILAGESRAYLAFDQQIVWMICAVLMMLWLPRIAMPLIVARAISLVAGASFQIYLTHNAIVHLFVYEMGIRPLLVIVILSVLIGVATQRLLWNVERRLRMPATADREI